MRLPDGVRVEVAAPLDGRRCPCRVVGRSVVAACGAISDAMPVYVVCAPAAKEAGEKLLDRLQRWGYAKAALEREEAAARKGVSG